MQKILYAMVLSIFLIPTAAHTSWYYRYSETITKEVPFNPDALLTIDAYAGSITILAHQENKIIVEATKRAVSKKALDNLDPFIRMRNHEGQIVSRFKNDSWLNGAITGAIDYVIKVPASIHLPRIVSGPGEITIQGIRGLINIAAGTGAVLLRNVVGGITVSTTAGAISIYCAADAQGIIDAKSNAGVIIIEGARDSVRAHTIAGSISVVQKDVIETTGITLESGMGSISLTLPSLTHARLQAQTHMGTFYCSFPLTHTANMQQGILSKNIDATIGAGSSALIKLATSSGAINIYK